MITRNRESEDDPLNELNDEERVVLIAICDAFSNEDQHILSVLEIKERLDIDEGQARSRLTRIYKKLKIEGSDQEKRFRLILKFCMQKEEPLQTTLPPVEVPLQEGEDEAKQKRIEEEKIKSEQQEEPRLELEELYKRIEEAVITENTPAAQWRPSARWIAIGLLGIVIVVGVFALVSVLRGNGNNNQEAFVPTNSFALVQPIEIPQPSPPTETFVSKPKLTLSSVPSDTAFPIIASAPTNTSIAVAIIPPTSTPTDLPTATPRPTFTPSPEPSPLDLKLGDAWSDNRVSLKLTNKIEYSKTYGGSSAVWFYYEFTNKLGQDVLLSFNPADFILKDNLDGDYGCWYVRHNPLIYLDEEVQVTVKVGSTYKFILGCGRNIDFDNQVTTLILTAEKFSSLPMMTWAIEIPR